MPHVLQLLLLLLLLANAWPAGAKWHHHKFSPYMPDSVFIPFGSTGDAKVVASQLGGWHRHDGGSNISGSNCGNETDNLVAHTPDKSNGTSPNPPGNTSPPGNVPTGAVSARELLERLTPSRCTQLASMNVCFGSIPSGSRCHTSRRLLICV